MASTGVVLINWNAGEFTIPCIKSLLTGIVRPDEIVVVDNASSDGSTDIIAEAFPEVVIIRNRVNRGFAGGNNDGIAYLLNKNIDYIWLLNNDTIVDAKCLSTLSSVAKKNLSAAGFSAKIYYYQYHKRLWYGGAYRQRGHLAIKHYMDLRLDESAINGVVPVPFISGCCMFVPSWAWRKYGGFIEDYIAYSEDNEWCWRATLNGAKIYYVPEATLWHRISSSIKKNLGLELNSDISPQVIYLSLRNQIWTIRRHTHGVSKWIALGIIFGIAIKNILISFLQKKATDAQAYIQALIDGHANSELTPKNWTGG